DQAEPLAEVLPQRAEHPGDDVRLVGTEEHRRARLRADRLELRLREELQDRRARLAGLVVDDVGEALGAPALRELLEVSELGARELLRDREAPNRGRAGEDVEAGLAGRVSDVADLEPEAQVGL